MEAASAQTRSVELPAAGCITFLHLPEVLQQDRDGLPHDAGVGGHGCQGLQAALPQGAVVMGALLLPLCRGNTPQRGAGVTPQAPSPKGIQGPDPARVDGVKQHSRTSPCQAQGTLPALWLGSSSPQG